MAIHISFHNQGLVEVNVINDKLTSLKIYDREKPFGGEVTFYFDNPTGVVDWAFQIANKAHEVNKQYVLDKLGV